LFLMIGLFALAVPVSLESTDAPLTAIK
jgi:hypothetical protein